MPIHIPAPASSNFNAGEPKWQCPLCNFANTYRNEICGGNGPLGCKTPRAQLMNGDSSYGDNSYGVAKGKGTGKESWRSSPYDGGQWMCPHCNFRNRSNNEVCGGSTGPVGCKAPRPVDATILGSDQPALSESGGVWGNSSGSSLDGLNGSSRKPPRSSSLGPGEWFCKGCNFKNVAINWVCGGKGPVGCKAPREWSDPTAHNQYAPGSASGEWLCSACNFRNKSGNSVCGGKGPVGCKAPRELVGTPLRNSSSSSEMQTGGLVEDTSSSFEVQTGGLVTDASSSSEMQAGEVSLRELTAELSPSAMELLGPELAAFLPESEQAMLGLSATPRTGQSSTGGVSRSIPSPASVGDWICKACNFKNRASNSICGGKGLAGCKTPRDLPTPAPAPAVSPRVPAEPSIPGGLGDWVCEQCNFFNKVTNGICGGKGAAGCKIKRPLPKADPTVVAMYMAQAQQEDLGDRWLCAACNFKNSPNNQVCGGNGPVGCKAPRPMMEGQLPQGQLPQEQLPQGFAGQPSNAAQPDSSKLKMLETMKGYLRGKAAGKGKPKDGPEWLCEFCGFKNTMRNEICGGSGPMGCNSPKPANIDPSTGQQMDETALLMAAVGQSMPDGTQIPTSEEAMMQMQQMQQMQQMRQMGAMSMLTNALSGMAGQTSAATPANKQGGLIPGPQSGSGGWLCSCGWRNSPKNQFCGGVNPNLGCKAPKPTDGLLGVTGFNAPRPVVDPTPSMTLI